MIEIIPAIDIIGGKCVRLSEGDYSRKKVYDCSPSDMERQFADCGVRRIHMVDLDGARISSPANLAVLESVASGIDCEIEWGGGIAGTADLKSVFDAGAGYAIVGSVAALHPDVFKGWLADYGEKMILGADVRNGKISVKGWQEDTSTGISDFLPQFLPSGLKEVICTDIGTDGLLGGPSFDLYTCLQERFPELSFTVSGGISSMMDIRKLDSLHLHKVIVGKAIYEHRITLKEIEQWSQNA